MAHSESQEKSKERESRKSGSLIVRLTGLGERYKTDKVKYLRDLKKQNLVEIVIDNENYIDKLETELETLNTNSDRRIYKLESEASALKSSNRKELDKREKRIKNLESKFSCFQRDVSDIIEKSRDVKIFGGNFKITTLGSAQIGKTNVIVNEEKTLTDLEEYLKEVRTNYTRILQKWAETKQELQIMKDTLKQTFDKVNDVSKGHTDIAGNISIVLEMVSLPQERICEKGFNVIKEWNFPQEDVTTDCLPNEAAALHRLLVAKYKGKHENRLFSAFGQIPSTHGATFPNRCAKWLVSWIRADEDRSSSDLLNLLKILDEEILAEEAQNIVNSANRSSTQNQENNETSKDFDEIEVTNTHLLRKLLQNQDMLIEVVNRHDQLWCKLFKENQDKEDTKSSASIKTSKIFHKPVVTVV